MVTKKFNQVQTGGQRLPPRNLLRNGGKHNLHTFDDPQGLFCACFSTSHCSAKPRYLFCCAIRPNFRSDILLSIPLALVYSRATPNFSLPFRLEQVAPLLFLTSISLALSSCQWYSLPSSYVATLIWNGTSTARFPLSVHASLVLLSLSPSAYFSQPANHSTGNGECSPTFLYMT